MTETAVRNRPMMLDGEPEEFPNVRNCGRCREPVTRSEAVILETLDKTVQRYHFAELISQKVGRWYHARCLRADTLFPEMVADGIFDPLPDDADMTFPHYIHRIDDKPDYWETEQGRREIAGVDPTVVPNERGELELPIDLFVDGSTWLRCPVCKGRTLPLLFVKSDGKFPCCGLQAFHGMNGVTWMYYPPLDSPLGKKVLAQLTKSRSSEHI